MISLEVESKRRNLSSFCCRRSAKTTEAVKLDFFLIHAITAALPLAIMLQQPWISTAVKVRLTERMGRLALAAYVGCGFPDLLLDKIVDYMARYKDEVGEQWVALKRRAVDIGDDGHAAKFVRGLMHGQKLSEKFEGNPNFVVKGDM